jgi:hypothetical protein
MYQYTLRGFMRSQEALQRGCQYLAMKMVANAEAVSIGNQNALGVL